MEKFNHLFIYSFTRRMWVG